MLPVRVLNSEWLRCVLRSPLYFVVGFVVEMLTLFSRFQCVESVVEE